MDKRIWACVPQVRDLPREMAMTATCVCCGARRVETVGGLVERRLGAQYVDLLEWQMRCADEACGGRVALDYAGKADHLPPRPQVVVAVTPRVQSRPVARPVARPRQYVLPLVAPLSVAGRAVAPV